ncbi:MAG: hypothetical protein IJM02_03535 [Clostridia bacterium]|nr:hypothetical protein [Clostridia bacterium]
MALDKRKTMNIVTIAAGALAVILVTVVILVKTGVLKPSRSAESTTDGTVIVSEVVEYSEVNDEGEIEYYTMINYYMKPSISSNHSYPYVPPKTTTVPETTTEKEYYIEYTDVEEETDENGEKVTDEQGRAVTKQVVHTKKTDEQGNVIENGTTAEPTTVTTSQQTTSIVYRTDPISKKPIKNIRGEYITIGIATEAPTTTTTTTKPVVHVKGETTTKAPETTTKKQAESTTSDTSVTNPSTENVPSSEAVTPVAAESDRGEVSPAAQ